MASRLQAKILYGMKQITKAQAHKIIKDAVWINKQTTGEITELIIKTKGDENRTSD